MKIRQLQYLCAVHKYGSMSRAARMLFISQPTLSVAIRDLEREYGVTMIVLEKGRVKFTSAGLTMVEGAEKILAMVDALSRQMSNLSEEVQEIRMGFSAAMSKQIVPRLMKTIASYEREHPKVKVRPVECQYNQQFAALRSGVTTLAFGFGKSSKVMEPDLEYIPLFETEIKLCVGPEHPLAKRAVVSLEEFEQENLLTFLMPDSRTNLAIFDWAKEQGREIEFHYYSQIGAVEELIRMGYGVALLVPSIYIRNPEIVTVAIEDAVILQYGIYYLKSRQLSKEELEFIELIRVLLSTQ